MTRAVALIALAALEGEDAYSRLLDAVRRSPEVLDPQLAVMVESAVEREHLRSEFLAPRTEARRELRTRGQAVKYQWER